MPHPIRQRLSQRIVFAFVLMSLLVAGAFAIGTILTIHLVEERLLSAELGSELDRLLQVETVDEWRAEPQPGQLFYFSGGHDEFAMPPDLAGFGEGFHEVFRGEQSFHAMVRIVGDRHYILLQDQSDFERREQTIYVVITCGFIGSLLLAALLGRLLARRVMEPVIRLASQVRHRDQQLAAAPPLAPDYAPDEVGQLAYAFDETFSQLRAALSRERLFTSDVSHELRTPLMVLASSCELLRENPQLSDAARRQVGRIERATRDMQDLVQTFLQLARPGSATESSAPTSSLQAMAQELVEFWRGPIASKGLQLVCEGMADDSRQWDATLLRAVMGNLLRNAWHYTDSGSIRLILQPDGFCVEDSGAGIPEALRQTIFEPFVRGDHSRGDGLGLGLSLVKRICRVQGWEIRLEAVQPHGCRFSVCLRPGAGGCPTDPAAAPAH